MVQPINQASLGLGIVYPQIIDVVFNKYDNLMLICSKNQVDYDAGYVFDTAQLGKIVDKQRNLYPEKNIWICRDHCGPGFKNHSIEDCYETIKSDIENGFDLLHIDFCHLEDKTKIHIESARAMEYALELNPNIKFELGTEDNDNADIATEETITKDLDFFTSIAPIEYYVLKTHSLVKENLNLDISTEQDWVNGKFLKLSNIIKEYGIKIKEHNADYLNAAQIRHRAGILDALNIAPELAYIVNKFYDFTFKNKLNNEIFNSNVWKKWHLNNLEHDESLRYDICAHYFQNKYPFPKPNGLCYDHCYSIIEKCIDRYVDNFIPRSIEKPWGNEQILNLGSYMTKRLFMKAGEACSLQKHKYKNETIYVLEGKLQVTIEGHTTTLFPHEYITIQKEVAHRMTAITNCIYLEASDPYQHDVIRLEDKYGRI